MKLESERLKLRILKKNDINDIMKFWGNQKVMSFCPGTIANPVSLKKTVDFYENLQKTRNFSVYGVELKSEGILIGACGFNPTENDDKIELIYHFAENYWGYGYATEACECAINYIRSLENINIIEASVIKENSASEKILLKLNFEFIGEKYFEDSKSFENCYEFMIY
ncbi:GNAT family N-acetyltransferase [Clostridiaceae bacterium HSG29]|nr:GNAT family N-acetyltransferase [Clostridiaceae bacterium HSG29]